MNNIPLDQLEVMIQLVKITDENLVSGTCKELKQAIDSKFNVDSKLEDIFLIHEPTIEENSIDMQVFYANMFNFSPIINKFNE